MCEEPCQLCPENISQITRINSVLDFHANGGHHQALMQTQPHHKELAYILVKYNF